MSEFIKVYRCERCGSEIYTRREGNPENPDGKWRSTAKYYALDKSRCPKCQKKRR